MLPINWEQVRSEYQDLAQKLVSPDLDQQTRSTYQKKYATLGHVLTLYDACSAAENELKQTQLEAATTTDPEMIELFHQEIEQLQRVVKEKQKILEEQLFPPSPLDARSVFLEIRAGAGGQEAALFASDLQKMYTNYGMNRGWRVNIDSLSETDLKGVREVVLHIAGKGVYGALKQESGVHRVQRVPSTETQGRIHTSTATVAVLPEAEEVDLTINPADLRVDVFRASGAGGQHVNKTESAVRITHIPTNIVVSCQEDRSQHKNRDRAMKMLKSRMLAAQVEAQHEKMSKLRKEQVGTGMRAEKVRTYNYPQNRVTDHQVNLTLNKLDRIMQGDMDEIIDALWARDVEERRKMPSFLQ